ncbi:hypothetical protein ACFL4D_00885, partial [Candidatus Margulisiibacteriota bacterium]
MNIKKILFILAIIGMPIISTFGAGQSYTILGKVTGNAVNDTGLTITRNLYLNPDRGAVRTGPLILFEGDYTFQDNIGNFTSPWQNGDDIIVFYEYEVSANTGQHVAYFGVNNNVAYSVDNATTNITTMNIIPTPQVTQVVGDVQVTWDVPVESIGIPQTTNVIGYYLYRSTSSANGYALVSTNYLTTTNYLDTTAGNSPTESLYYAIKLVFRGEKITNVFSGNSDQLLVADYTSPNVEIIRVAPSVNRVISNSITVWGTVTDDREISSWVLRDGLGVTINGAVGVGSAVVTINGVLTSNWDVSSYTQGAVTLTLTAVDASGLVTTHSFAVTIDNKAPTLGVTLSLTGYTSVRVITINLSAEDLIVPTTDLDIMITGNVSASAMVGSWIDFEESITINLHDNEGTNTVSIWIRDLVGNTTVNVSTIILDLTDPVITTININSDKAYYFYSPSQNAVTKDVYFNNLAGEGEDQRVTLSIFWSDGVNPYPDYATGNLMFGEYPTDNNDSLLSTLSYTIEVGVTTTRNTIDIRVVDKSGRFATTSVYFVRDVYDPTLNIVEITTFNMREGYWDTPNWLPTDNVGNWYSPRYLSGGLYVTSNGTDTGSAGLKESSWVWDSSVGADDQSGMDNWGASFADGNIWITGISQNSSAVDFSTVTITITVTDNVGNADTDFIVIKMDRVSPDITATAPVETKINIPYTVTFNPTENIGSDVSFVYVAVSLSNTVIPTRAYTPEDFTVTLSGITAPSADHYYVYYVMDNVGNTSNTFIVTVSVGGINTPAEVGVEDIIVSSSVIYGGYDHTFVVQYHDADGWDDLSTVNFVIHENAAFPNNREEFEGVVTSSTGGGVLTVANGGILFDSFPVKDNQASYIYSATQNTVTVTWNITPKWTWSEAISYKYGVKGIDDDGEGITSYVFTPADVSYNVDINLTGNLVASINNQVLTPNIAWVKGGSTVNWTNVKVIYQGALGVYPPSENAYVEFTNEASSIVRATPDPGVSLNISVAHSAITSANAIQYLELYSAYRIAPFRITANLSIDSTLPEVDLVQITTINSGNGYYDSNSNPTDNIGNYYSQKLLTDGLTITFNAQDIHSGLSEGYTSANVLFAHPVVPTRQWLVPTNGATVNFGNLTDLSDATINIVITVTDNVGNAKAVTMTVVFDSTTPNASGLTINNGVAKTSTETLTLSLSATDNITITTNLLVYIDGDILNADNVRNWVSYTETIAVTASITDGTNSTVNVTFKDQVGNTSNALIQTIIVDTRNIEIRNVTSSPEFVAQGQQLTINFSINKENIATTSLRVGEPEDAAQNWATFITSNITGTTTNYTYVYTMVSAANGYITVDVRATDDVVEGSNTGATFNVAISQLDNLLPGNLGAATLNNGISLTATSVNVLTLAVTDNLSGVVSYFIYGDVTDNEFVSANRWTTYNASITINLQGADGVKRVSVNVRDLVGNVSTISKALTVNLDTTAPTFSNLLAIPVTINQGTTVTLTVSVNEVVGVATTSLTVIEPGSSTINQAVFSSSTAGTYTYVYTALYANSNGWATLNLSATDNAGNRGTSVNTIALLIDNTAPQITGITLNNYRPTTNVSINIPVSFNITDALSAVVSMQISGDVLDSDFVSVNKWVDFVAITSINVTDGDAEKTVTFSFRDDAGNTTSTVRTIIFDITSPNSLITLVSPSVNSIVSASITVRGTATDNVAFGEWILRDGAGTILSSSSVSTVNGVLSSNWDVSGYVEGPTTISLTVVDTMNLVQINSFRVTIDHTAPTIDGVSISNTEYTSTALVTLNLSASDNISPTTALQMLITGNVNTSNVCKTWTVYSTQTMITLNLANGVNTVNVYLKDEVGNVTSSLATINYDASTPNAIILSVAPSINRILSGSVTIRGTATDNVSFGYWVLKDGSGNTLNTDVSQTINGVLTSNWDVTTYNDGAMDLTLTAYDTSGQSGQYSFGVTIDNRTPTISSLMISNSDFTPSAQVTLNISAEDFITPTGSLMMFITGNIDSGPLVNAWVNYSAAVLVTLNIDDSLNTVTVSVRDEAGHVTVDADSIVLDNGNPTAAILSVQPSVNRIISGSVTVLGIATDNIGIGYWVLKDDSGLTLNTGVTSRNNDILTSNWDVSVVTEGARILTLTVVDTSNRIVEDTFAVTVDHTAPTLGVTLSATGYTIVRTLTMNLSVTDNISLTSVIDIYITGNVTPAAGIDSWISYSSAIVVTINAPEGVNTVNILARDEVGNIATYTATVILDLTDPTISTINVSSSLADYFYSASSNVISKNVYFNNLAGEGAGQVVTLTVLWDDGVLDSPDYVSGNTIFGDSPIDNSDVLISTLSYSLEVGVTTTRNTVNIKVVDKAGRLATAAVYFVRDVVDPTLNIVAITTFNANEGYWDSPGWTPTDNTGNWYSPRFLSGGLIVTSNVTENTGAGLSQVGWVWASSVGADNQSGTDNYGTSYLDGNLRITGLTGNASAVDSSIVTLTITVTDNVGNVATDSIVLRMDQTAPTFNISANSIITLGQEYTVTVTVGTDPDGSGYQTNYLGVTTNETSVSWNIPIWEGLVTVGTTSTVQTNYYYYAMPVDNLGNTGNIQNGSRLVNYGGNNIAPTLDIAWISGTQNIIYANKAIITNVLYTDGNGFADIKQAAIRLSSPTRNITAWFDPRSESAGQWHSLAREIVQDPLSGESGYHDGTGDALLNSVQYIFSTSGTTVNVTWNILTNYKWRATSNIQYKIKATDQTNLSTPAGATDYLTITTNSSFINSLVLTGSIEASTNIQGDLTSNITWIKAGDTVNWGGLRVVYAGTAENTPTTDYTIAITRNGTAFSRTVAQQGTMSITTTASATSTTDVYAMALALTASGLGGSVTGNATFNVLVDGTVPSLQIASVTTLSSGAGYWDEGGSTPTDSVGNWYNQELLTNGWTITFNSQDAESGLSGGLTTASVYFSISDAPSLSAYLSPTDSTTFTGLTASPDGVVTVTVTVTDNVGNVTTAAMLIRFDNTSPNVTATAPVQTAMSVPYLVTFNPTDNTGSGVKYVYVTVSLNNTAVPTTPYTPVGGIVTINGTTAPSANHYYIYYVEDQLGITSDTYVVTVTVGGVNTPLIVGTENITVSSSVLYGGYQNRLVVEYYDEDGWADISTVNLKVFRDPVNTNILEFSLTVSESTGTGTATLNSTGARILGGSDTYLLNGSADYEYSGTQNTVTLTLNFTAKWGSPWQEAWNIGYGVMGVDEAGEGVTSYKYTNSYVSFENDIELTGNLTASTNQQGVVTPAVTWIRGGSTVNWTDIKVVYVGTTAISPPSANYNLQLKDGLGTTLITTTPDVGVSLDINVVEPALTSANNVHTLLLSAVGGVDGPGTDGARTEITFNLKVDSTAPSMAYVRITTLNTGEGYFDSNGIPTDSIGNFYNQANLTSGLTITLNAWDDHSTLISGFTSGSITLVHPGLTSINAFVPTMGVTVNFGDLTNLADGTVNITIKVTDNVGLASSRSMTVRFDATTPNAIALTINTGSGFARTAQVTLNLAATDNITSTTNLLVFVTGDLQAAANIDSWIPYSEAMAVTVSNSFGRNTVNVLFKDEVGNTSNTLIQAVEVDTRNIVISAVTSSPQVISVGDTLTINFTINKSNIATTSVLVGEPQGATESLATYVTANISGGTTNFTYLYTALTTANGTITVSVWATDNVVENLLTGQTLNVSISSLDNLTPNISTITYTASNPDYIWTASANNISGAEIYLNTLASAGAGNTITMNILWNDQNPQRVTATFNPAVAIDTLIDNTDTINSVLTFNIPVNMASSTMTVTVEDQYGRASSINIFFIQDNQAPSVAIISATTFNAGQGYTDLAPFITTDNIGNYYTPTVLAGGWTITYNAFDGNALVYGKATANVSLSGTTTNILQSAPTGAATLMGLENEAGTINVTITVTDNVGNIATTSMVIRLTKLAPFVNPTSDVIASPNLFAGYNNQIVVLYHDNDGWNDISTVNLAIDNNAAGRTVLNFEFNVSNNPQATVSGVTMNAPGNQQVLYVLTANAVYASLNATTIKVTWNIVMDWDWEDSGPGTIRYGVNVSDIDDRAQSSMLYTARSKIYDEDINFSGELTASNNLKGALTKEGTWIAQGTTVTWDGLKVSYATDSSVYPPTSSYTVSINSITTGRKWNVTPDSGISLNFVTTADSQTRSDDVHVFKIDRIPDGVGGNVTFNIKTDALAPTIQIAAVTTFNTGEGYWDTANSTPTDSIGNWYDQALLVNGWTITYDVTELESGLVGGLTTASVYFDISDSPSMSAYLAPTGSVTFTGLTASTDGVVTVTVRVTDNAGNASSVSMAIRFDKLIPQATATAPIETRVSESYTVTINPTDNTGSGVEIVYVAISINNTVVPTTAYIPSNNTVTINGVNAPSGDYYYVYYVRDRVGNTSNISVVTVSVGALNTPAEVGTTNIIVKPPVLYSGYENKIVVQYFDVDGWADISTVNLEVRDSIDDLKITFTGRVTSSIGGGVLTNANGGLGPNSFYADKLMQSQAIFEYSGTQNMVTVTWNVDPKWVGWGTAYANDYKYGVKVYDQNGEGVTSYVYTPTDVNYMNQMGLTGNLIASSNNQGGITENVTWIRGGTTVNWTNVRVVYRDSGDIYPASYNYNVELRDQNESTLLIKTTPNTGVSLDVEVNEPAITTANDLHTLILINVDDPYGGGSKPVSSGRIRVTFNLSIDTTAPD